MEMPQPSEKHRKLEKLVGIWIGDETIAPNPWDQGGPARGCVDNKPAANGFIVVQNYEQRRNGQTSFTGHGVFQYDAKADRYLMYWWDSMGMPPSVFTGTFEEDDTLTLTCDEPAMKSRATFIVSDFENYSFKMEVSQDGANWMTFMEGTYERWGPVGDGDDPWRQR